MAEKQDFSRKVLASYLDHAVLDPSFTLAQLKENIMIGVDYGCKSVCVNPDAIDVAKDCIRESHTLLCVVCDFPFGSSHTESKLVQTQAIIDKGGIFEIDMVANYGYIKSHQYDDVTNEIAQISRLCHHHDVGLKVIIETDALTHDEIKAAVQCCVKGKADFVKTSTGYYKGDHNVGASPDIMKMIIKEANHQIKVKASGGVRSKERLIELIHLGIDRAGVGCSSTKKILDEAYE